MTNTAYTAGYSGATLQGLAQVAEKLDAVVFDIRLNPHSRMAEWNQRPMQERLGDRYQHVSSLGNLNYRRGGSIAIADLQAGTTLVRQSAKPVILLCGCRDARRCHRTVVAHHLRQLRLQVEELTVR
jgi:uncharacterized protein (DUF488 family)